MAQWEGNTVVGMAPGQTGGSGSEVTTPPPESPGIRQESTYVDSSGNVHVVQDYTAQGGGRYDTVVAGPDTGSRSGTPATYDRYGNMITPPGGDYVEKTGPYSGSGFEQQRAGIVESPRVWNELLSASERDPGVRRELETTGILKYDVEGKTFSKRDEAEGYAAQLNREREQTAQQQQPRTLADDAKLAREARQRELLDRSSGLEEYRDINNAGEFGKKPPMFKEDPFGISTSIATGTQKGLQIIDENLNLPRTGQPQVDTVIGAGEMGAKGLVSTPLLLGIVPSITKKWSEGRIRDIPGDIAGGGMLAVEGVNEKPWETGILIAAGVAGPKVLKVGGKAVGEVTSTAKAAPRWVKETIGDFRAKGNAGAGIENMKGGLGSGIKSERIEKPSITSPPEGFPFDYGGQSGITVTRGSGGMKIVDVGAASAVIGATSARATPTKNQLKAYETAKEYSEGKTQVTSITPPSSPSKVHLNVAQEGAIEFNRGLASELGKTIDNVKVDRKGRVVRKPQGFDVQATDEILVESDYFNKVKEESRPEVRHRKDISIGDEEPGILTYKPEEIPKGGGKNTLPSREELFGKAPNIEEFRVKPSTKRLAPRANLRKAYLNKVVSDAEWRDYETWKEAGRMDVIDRKYPTPEPKPVTEADIGYDLKKAVYKKIVDDAEWIREERKLNQQNQIPKDMRKLGMGYLVEAKVRPRRRGTRAILQEPREPEYGAYSEIAIPLPLERELVVEAPQELVAIAKQRPVAVAVQRQQQAQKTKQTPSLMVPLQTAQIEIPAWEPTQPKIAVQARVQKQTQKYAQVSDQVPDLLSVIPPAQKQRSGQKQVSIEKQIQKQMQKQRTVQPLRPRPRGEIRGKPEPKPPSMKKVFGTVRIAPIWEPGALPARKTKRRRRR